MPLDQLIHSLAMGIEVAGLLVLVAGGLVATVAFARQWAELGLDKAYHAYRANLGRAILLGLEFLVAADIIDTVTLEPSFRNLGVLAGIVLIRTFLSFSLEVEIGGRWPWQRGVHPEHAPPST